MLSGVDTLKFVSNQLESIDRITEVPPSKHDSWQIPEEHSQSQGGGVGVGGVEGRVG